MSAMMRCDGCKAMRWYGAPLQQVYVAEFPGPREHVYFVCEVCFEERMLALNSPADDEHYLPTMHPPHISKQ